MFDFKKYNNNIAVVCADGQQKSYAELEEECIEFHHHILTGSLVFCLCENTWASLVGYVACLSHRHPILLLDGKKDLELVKRLVAIYQPKYLWMPSSRVTEFGEGDSVYSMGGYELLEMPYTQFPIHPNLALLLTTSGSTGSPKLVRLTADNLRSNAEAIAEYLGIDEHERAITSLPMYYSFGMSVINSHLIQGATLLLTDSAVTQKEFWTMMREEHATSIAGVPYTYEMLRRLRFFRMELPHLKTMIQAGGKLNAAIAKEYIDFAQSSGRRFFVMYGQTEAAPRMSYLPFERALEKYASIGVPIPGGKLSIRDVDDNPIDEADVDGELIYEGPNVCYGYAECKEDFAKGDENNGTLHTGDVARKDKDGFFYITGRMKRFVKVWGNRCNLDATEQLVKSITTNCACVGVDDLITVFVTEQGLEDRIKKYLVEKTGLNSRAFKVRIIDEIPTKSSGKLDYQALQALINGQ